MLISGSDRHIPTSGDYKEARQVLLEKYGPKIVPCQECGMPVVVGKKCDTCERWEV